MSDIETKQTGTALTVVEPKLPLDPEPEDKQKNGPRSKGPIAKPTLTADIKILGRGASDTGQRFVKLGIDRLGGPKVVLLRTDNLGSKQDAFNHLNKRAGANILSSKTRTELLSRFESEAPMTESFRVVTKTGMDDGVFYLPDAIIPANAAAAEVYFDDLPDDIRLKYTTAGTLEGWQKAAKYARRNSRMAFAYALQFVGPLSGIMSIESVSGQLFGEGGIGKTAIGVAACSTWGSDPDPAIADRVGFGGTWNSTGNNRERDFAGYNQTIVFLDETRASANTPGKRAQDVLDGIVKIERSLGKGRLTDSDPKRSWFGTLLSTSNVSVMELLKAAGREFDAAYIDRLPDIPAPKGGHGMFEDLHGFDDVPRLAGN